MNACRSQRLDGVLLARWLAQQSMVVHSVGRLYFSGQVVITDIAPDSFVRTAQA